MCSPVGYYRHIVAYLPARRLPGVDLNHFLRWSGVRYSGDLDQSTINAEEERVRIAEAAKYEIKGDTRTEVNEHIFSIPAPNQEQKWTNICNVLVPNPTGPKLQASSSPLFTNCRFLLTTSSSSVLSSYPAPKLPSIPQQPEQPASLTNRQKSNLLQKVPFLIANGSLAQVRVPGSYIDPLYPITLIPTRCDEAHRAQPDEFEKGIEKPFAQFQRKMSLGMASPSTKAICHKPSIQVRCDIDVTHPERCDTSEVKKKRTERTLSQSKTK
ncbi:hypothetical protein CPB83DRAFT_914950 [Crepidotus variabilis]|uniref:Uncharacterized protein n=1 Tax=Crepidotus variabilis TaxID=179855 RepID=A0A9P6E5X9_9AGAR|nr:hypothetical protein CPB83DRAFT_914950 [Crepidotus variabilis]